MNVFAAGKILRFMVSFLLAAVAPLVQALNYPQRPIRMIVGFTPGGGTDQVARIVGMKAGEQLGQQIVIDNRPGAGGNVAADYLSHASPRIAAL